MGEFCRCFVEFVEGLVEVLNSFILSFVKLLGLLVLLAVVLYMMCTSWEFECWANWIATS